ncbi:lamin tail domain-containing protein [uncultured Winogradskyella sp.]|uniref:lamin tail domain-containing protein n=1 Tax=uncultured Winogradskyella sp. TaxID=395353 RepID=UPI00351601C9
MKKFYISLLGLLITSLGFGQDLVITAAYDGPLSGGTPKGVELYVINDIPDLSLYGLGSANNGGGSDGEEFTFPADAVTAGTYLYVASESTEFTNWFGFAPNYTSGFMEINGDDAIELFFNGSVIDVFGDINTDGTGEPWEYMDGWAYRVDGTGPDGSTFTLANWTFSGPNALDDETTNASATTPIPIGSFTFGGSSCSITSTGLANITCNDNGTASDSTDDITSFELNPTGGNLGTTYTVDMDGFANISTSISGPFTTDTATANYGSSTTFYLEPGSAGIGGDLDALVIDDTDTNCFEIATITDPGSCSTAVPTVGFDTATSTEIETNTTITSSNIPITVSNYDGNQIDIDVSVTGGTAEPGDYTFTSPTSLSFTADGTQNITIDINDDADFDDETVELTITETSSVTGLVISQATHTVTIIDDETPPVPELIITEIMQNPSDVGDNSGEYFEVYNPTASAIDMIGWTISDNGSDSHTISSSVVVPSLGFAVLGINADNLTNGGVNVDYEYSGFTLANGDDEIILTDGSSNEIDRAEYDGGPNWPDPNGAAMIFIGSDTEDNNDGSLWAEATVSEGIDNDFGSPGTEGTNQIVASLVYKNGTWNLEPSTATGARNAVVVNGTYTLSSDININDMTIRPEASTIIPSSFTLTCTSLNLESTSSNFSSLISDGTIIGTVTYNRYVNSNDAVNGNDLISAPVTGQAFDVFIANNTNILANPSGTNVLFGGFDSDNASAPYELWDETDTTPLTAGVGYRTGIDPLAASNLVEFEGTVNNSLVEVPIAQGTASILSLVGNPFPSYMDAQAFLSHNDALLDPSAKVIYGYNDSTDGTSADDYTIISAIENNTLNIAPGQGFFVASNTTGGNLQFTTSTPDMRIIANDDDFIAGRNAASAITNVNINLSNASDNFITKVYFTPSSGLGLDPGYDASLIGGVAPAFALFTHLVEENSGVPFATQAIGKTDFNDTTIALGVNANMGEQLTFSIAENTLPASIEVYLDDTLTNTSTLLNTSDYVLTPAEALNGTGRFYLRFTNGALSLSDNVLDGISIYTNQSPKTITIAGTLNADTVAKVYDLQGRLVHTTALDADTTLHTIDANSLQTGVYIVNLVSGNHSKTQKVILN